MRSGTKFLLSSLLFISFVWITFHFLLPFLFPFLLGLLLALASEPLVRFFCRVPGLRRGFSSGIGVSCTFLFLSSLLLGILALIFRSMGLISQVLPDLLQAVFSGLDLMKQQLLVLARKAPQSVRPMLQQHVLSLFSDGTALLDEGSRYIFSIAGGALTQIPGQAFSLLTAVISGFMISAKLPRLKALLKSQFSGQWFQKLTFFLKSLRKTLGHWILAQLKLSGITFGILLLGFILLRIPYAPLWAVGIALLDAMPLLGTGIFLIPWSIVSFLQGNGVQALGLLGTYVSAALTRSLLEPRFVGRQLGLDPLLALVSMYAGCRLWGLGGMILSPLLAVTVFKLIPEASASGKKP